MGQFRDSQRMFQGVVYNKFTTPQVREGMERKVGLLCSKIRERGERITKLVADHGITESQLTDIVMAYMKDRDRERHGLGGYVTTTAGAAVAAAGGGVERAVIPASVVSAIVREKELVESESDELGKLRLVLRNLRDRVPTADPESGTIREREVVHQLTDDEIEYLGLSTMPVSA